MAKRMKRVSKKERRNYGEGSFYWRESRQKWEYKKSVGVKHKKEIRTQGATKTECLKKMKIREAEYLKTEGIVFETNDSQMRVLLQDAVENWLFTFKRETIKEKSFDTLEGVYRNQLKDSNLGKTFIDEVNPLLIQIYINELAKELSISTLKKVKSLLAQFYQYRCSGDMNANPMLMVTIPEKGKRTRISSDSPIISNQSISALSDDEMDKLTTELTKPFISGKSGYKYGYVLLFIMWSYIRVGEALALKWSDIDWSTGQLTIDKSYATVRKRDKEGKAISGSIGIITTPKTLNSIRVVPLYEKALLYLKKYEESIEDKSTNDYMFLTSTGNHVSVQQLNSSLKKASVAAGIPEISVHDLRHTGISFFLRHGMDVKVVSHLAGHADVSITMKTYYNLVRSQMDNPYEGFSKELANE